MFNSVDLFKQTMAFKLILLMTLKRMDIYAENMSPSNYTVEGKIFPKHFNDISRISCTFVLSLPVKGHIISLCKHSECHCRHCWIMYRACEMVQQCGVSQEVILEF